MYFDFHTHRNPTDSNVIAVVNQFPLLVNPNFLFSVGIHPCYIDEKNLEAEFTAMELWISHPNCFSVGECGLDRRSSVSMERQQYVFERQILLSEKCRKPLTIHCVKAFDLLLAMKKRIRPTQKWIVHGYRKNSKLAFDLLNNGILLSFGAALLYDQSLQELIQKIPDTAFFLETDMAEVSIKQIYEKVKTLKPQWSGVKL